MLWYIKANGACWWFLDLLCVPLSKCKGYVDSGKCLFLQWKNNLYPRDSVATNCCVVISSVHLASSAVFLQQVNQQAMAPMRGGHAALWMSAASKAVSCGAWRCTVHLPRLASLLALCVHSATQTCREHLRLVPQGTKWTKAQSVGQHSSQTRQKTRRWAQHRTDTLQKKKRFSQQEMWKKKENRTYVLVAAVRACTHDIDESLDTTLISGSQYEITANRWLV